MIRDSKVGAIAIFLFFWLVLSLMFACKKPTETKEFLTCQPEVEIFEKFWRGNSG